MNNLFVIELALIATGSATLHNFALIAVTCKAIEPLSHWILYVYLVVQICTIFQEQRRQSSTYWIQIKIERKESGVTWRDRRARMLTYSTCYYYEIGIVIILILSAVGETN